MPDSPYILKFPSGGICPVHAHIVNWQFELLHSIGRSKIYYKALERAYSNMEEGHLRNALVHLGNVSFLNFLIDWCKIFGSNNNKSHWKKIFYEAMALDKKPICTRDAFERNVMHAIFNECELDTEEYKKIVKSVKKARDKFAAHLDIGEIPEMPNLEVPYCIANALSCLYGNFIGDKSPSLKDLEEDFQSEIESIIEKLSPEK